MIKLIASDIDGTLLPKGQKTIDEDTLRVVSEILDNGIEFCAISGRPRNSVMNLFAPVADRIWVISDNGTILWEKGRTNKIAQLFEIRRDCAESLARALISFPYCEVTISTAEGHFLWAKNADLGQQLGKSFSVAPKPVADFSEVTGAITKVSAYCYDLASPHIKDFTETWGKTFHVAQADLEWIDFTFGDKGSGLAALCKKMSISSHDTAAFGDNYNDLPMLELVQYPFIHTSASAPLRMHIPEHRSTLHEVNPFIQEVKSRENYSADASL